MSDRKDAKSLGGLIRRKGDGRPAALPAASQDAPARLETSPRQKMSLFLTKDEYAKLRRVCFERGLSHQAFMHQAVRRALGDVE